MVLDTIEDQDMHQSSLEDIERAYNFIKLKKFAAISELEAAEIGMAGSLISATMMMGWLQASRGNIARAHQLFERAEAACAAQESGYVLHLHALLTLQAGDVHGWAAMERRVVELSEKFDQEDLFLDVWALVLAVLAALRATNLTSPRDPERFIVPLIARALAPSSDCE